MGLSEREQRVCEAIAARREALLDDLRLHVGLATGGGNVAALDQTRGLLTARAARLGASLEVKPGDGRPGWLWGKIGGSRAPNEPTLQPPPSGRAGQGTPVAVCRREIGAGRPLLIAGHLDTVHDPCGPFRELTISAGGACGVGPGCVDMKGGLVIALAALESLEECGVHLPWTLLLNSDEETGSYASSRIIFEEAARVAASGGIGIALEPAGPKGELIVERAGSGQFMVEVRGRPAHVGRDFGAGVSAVNVLAALILEIANLNDAARGLIVNIGPLEGGSATNIVPDRARAWGNVRFPDADSGKRLVVGIRRICESAVRAGVTVGVDTSLARPAKPLTPGVQVLADLARTVSGLIAPACPLPFGKTGGVCDGNIMQDAGLATLDTLGVRGGGLHTTDEWIEIASLVERAQLLAVFMIRASEQSGRKVAAGPAESAARSADNNP